MRTLELPPAPHSSCSASTHLSHHSSWGHPRRGKSFTLQPFQQQLLVRNCYFLGMLAHHRAGRTAHDAPQEISPPASAASPFPAAPTAMCRHKQRLDARNQEQQPGK